MEEKTEEKKKTKKFHLELSRTALFFWCFGFLIFLGWIFTLGVLAGRGLLPSGAKTLAELKSQIVKLQEMVGRKDGSELDEIKALNKTPEFAFYSELSAKKIAETPEPQKAKPKKIAREETPKPKADKPKEPDTASGTFYVVQVASLDEGKQAAKMVDRLVKKGYPAYYYKIIIKGRSYYRVRCGTFNTRAEAMDIQNRLTEKERLKGFIQEVKRDR